MSGRKGLKVVSKEKYLLNSPINKIANICDFDHKYEEY